MYGSETLQNTTDFFAPLAAHFRIFYFYEQHPTTVPLPGLFSGAIRDFIVPPASAVPAGHDDAERAGIAADHRGMVRFGDAGGQGFRVVVEALVRYCAEAGEVVRLRRLEEAGVLEGERAREVGEGLKSVDGVGGGVGQLGVRASDLLKGKVDSGVEEWMSRTATFRSVLMPDGGKDEKVAGGGVC